MTLKEEISVLLIKAGITRADLVRMLNAKYNRNISVQNFHQRLLRETVKYSEIKEIADILGYEIHWKPLEEKND